MRTLFVAAPFRRRGLSSWVKPLPPPPQQQQQNAAAVSTGKNLNACPWPGNPDYFTLRYADGNGLVTGSPVTKAEIQTMASQDNVSYPASCPPLNADATLSVPCNDGPDKQGYYDLLNNRFLLEQAGQNPNPHPLCPAPTTPTTPPAATTPPPATTTPPVTTTPATTPPEATTTPPPPTGVPMPTGPGSAPIGIQVQAFTPQGMGPIPVQNLPPGGGAWPAGYPVPIPVARPPAAPAAPAAPPPTAGIPAPIAAPPKTDLSAPLGIGAVVLGGVALALFG